MPSKLNTTCHHHSLFGCFFALAKSHFSSLLRGFEGTLVKSGECFFSPRFTANVASHVAVINPRGDSIGFKTKKTQKSPGVLSGCVKILVAPRSSSPRFLRPITFPHPGVHFWSTLQTPYFRWSCDLVTLDDQGKTVFHIDCMCQLSRPKTYKGRK